MGRASSLGEALKLPQGIGPARLPFQQLHLCEEFPVLTSGLRPSRIFQVELINNARRALPRRLQTRRGGTGVDICIRGSTRERLH
jgi:hypothetical protein